MSKSKILVAPLNWGLGHASRCIPIIKILLELGQEVVLGGDGQSLDLLQKEFPNLESVKIPDLEVSYPSKGNLTFHFIKQYRKIKNHIRFEHNLLQKIISESNIDAVISDNRYGLYNHNIPSIFLTHQVNIPIPWFGKKVNSVIHKYIREFDQCWIMDIKEDNSIAGVLSKTDKLSNISAYIGPVSRFKPAKSEKKYDIISILSGPEPHRSALEFKLIQELNSIEGKHILVRGSDISMNNKLLPNNNIEVHNILDSKNLDEKINASKIIVSRSGYSSIMDYLMKGRKAILIPTPGQPEQEYLAKYHRLKGQFIIRYNNQPDLKNAIIELEKLKIPTAYIENNELNKTLEDFCESLY